MVKPTDRAVNYKEALNFIMHQAIKNAGASNIFIFGRKVDLLYDCYGCVKSILVMLMIRYIKLMHL